MGARPFRFAVQSYSATSRKEWRERAIRAEALGYTTLHLADHFIGPGPASTQAKHPVQQLAAVPAMAVAAEATTTLRVGCRVFCQDYRHPAILAKEVATLDLLSEGRTEIGLGAGWLRPEYEAIHLPFDKASVRVARLRETVTLLKALLAGGQVSFAGEHFQVDGFEGAPRPIQRPHPPIMIGGGSEAVLSLAAREANIVSLNFNNRAGEISADGVKTSTAAATAEKVRWVRKAAGDRYDQLELEIGAYFVGVGAHAVPMATAMAGGFGLTTTEMMQHPHALFGSAEAICDELLRRREAYGVSYVTVADMVMESFAPVVAALAGK